MIVPFADMIVFAVLMFGAAIYYRKNAPTHKRLILLTVITSSRLRSRAFQAA
jgi:hypothetical protein